MNVHEQGPSIAIVGEEGLYHREPITFGVPFAEGTLTDASSVRIVSADGSDVPVQKSGAGHIERNIEDVLVMRLGHDSRVPPIHGMYVQDRESPVCFGNHPGSRFTSADLAENAIVHILSYLSPSITVSSTTRFLAASYVRGSIATIRSLESVLLSELLSHSVLCFDRNTGRPFMRGNKRFQEPFIASSG